jgi:hypothetical protein
MKMYIIERYFHFVHAIANRCNDGLSIYIGIGQKMLGFNEYFNSFNRDI